MKIPKSYDVLDTCIYFLEAEAMFWGPLHINPSLEAVICFQAQPRIFNPEIDFSGLKEIDFVAPSQCPDTGAYLPR
jgi:hypothetical protein